MLWLSVEAFFIVVATSGVPACLQRNRDAGERSSVGGASLGHPDLPGISCGKERKKVGAEDCFVGCQVQGRHRTTVDKGGPTYLVPCLVFHLAALPVCLPGFGHSRLLRMFCVDAARVGKLGPSGDESVT